MFILADPVGKREREREKKEGGREREGGRKKEREREGERKRDGREGRKITNTLKTERGFYIIRG